MYKIIPDKIFLKQIKRFDSSVKKHIREKINTLIHNPLQNKSFSIRGVNAFRIRMSINRKDFRLVYTFDGNIIRLICFEEREKVYDNLRSYMKKAGYKVKEPLLEYTASIINNSCIPSVCSLDY